MCPDTVLFFFFKSDSIYDKPIHMTAKIHHQNSPPPHTKITHILAHTGTSKAKQSKHRDHEDSERVTERRACDQHRWRCNNKTNPSDKPHEHKRQRKEGERAKRVGVWLGRALCAHLRD